MPAKITRLDARRDPEAVEWAKELRETETWFHSERFGHITRLHTPFEVVSLRGSLQEDYTIARESARKMHHYLRRLFVEKKQEITYGPFSSTGAVRAAYVVLRIDTHSSE